MTLLTLLAVCARLTLCVPGKRKEVERFISAQRKSGHGRRWFAVGRGMALGSRNVSVTERKNILYTVCVSVLCYRAGNNC